MKCFCAAGMSTLIGLGFIEAQPNSRRTTPSDAYRNTTMTSSCRTKGERKDKSDVVFCQGSAGFRKKEAARIGPRRSDGCRDGNRRYSACGSAARSRDGPKLRFSACLLKTA